MIAEPARSGWCLTSDHDRCQWSGCHCSCGHGVNLATENPCPNCPFKGCECDAKGGG